MHRPSEQASGHGGIASGNALGAEDSFDGGYVLGLVHTMGAVVHHNDFDAVSILQHLQLLQVLHQLRQKYTDTWEVRP